MNDITNQVQRRLRQCFELAFPNANPQSIDLATMESIEGWDSVATLMLVSTVEEEFSIKVGFDRLPELTSFPAFYEFVISRLNG